MTDRRAHDEPSEDDYCLMDDAVSLNTPKPSTDRHNSVLQDNVAVKKGLVTLNELNDKFMRSNSYYIFLGVFLYITVGVSVYHHWLEWDQLDSLYFIMSTVTTVGYGDFVPDSPNEKMFTSFYIIVGIAMFGMLVGIVTTFLFDHQERMNKQRSMRAFVIMKEQKNPPVSHNHSMNGRYGHSIDSMQSSFTETSNATGGIKIKRNRSFFDYAYSFRPSMERVEKTFEEIREESVSSYKEDLITLRWQSAGDFVGIFLLLLFGMLVMMGIESWGAVDSFYWATISLTTVGYGDIVPISKSGIVFTIFYVVFGCAFLGKALTDFVKYPLLSRVLKNEIEIVNQFAGDLSPEKLESIFQNDFYKLIPDLKRSEKEMTKCEFVLMVLQLMNKVEEKDIFLVSKLFENLDKDRKGFLSEEEMTEQLTAARESVFQRDSMGKRPESLDSGGGLLGGGGGGGGGGGARNVTATHKWAKRTDSTQSPSVSNRKISTGTGASKPPLETISSFSGTSAASATSGTSSKSTFKRTAIPVGGDATVNALLAATGHSVVRSSSGVNTSSVGRIFNDENDDISVGDSSRVSGTVDDDNI